MEDGSFKTMADFLMIVLIIFLLMLVTLTLDVSNKIHAISHENTYSGGKIRPSLILSPIIWGNGDKTFTIYKTSDIINTKKNLSVNALIEKDILSFLSFVDPGRIEYGGKQYDLLDIQAYQSIAHAIHRTPDGSIGKVDNNLLDELRDIAFGNHDSFDRDEFYRSNIIHRTEIYYMSKETDTEKAIVIGHFPIRLSEENAFFMMTSLATPLADFIYLGKYDRDNIIVFFKQYGGTEAANYYRDWLISSDGIRLPPFIKYPEVAKQFIKDKKALNLVPPKWVKEQFLDKIGANLKIAG